MELLKMVQIVKIELKMKVDYVIIIKNNKMEETVKIDKETKLIQEMLAIYAYRQAEELN